MHLICNWRPLEPVSTNSSCCCLLSTRVATYQIISWSLDPIKNTKQLPCFTYQKKMFNLYFVLGYLPLFPSHPPKPFYYPTVRTGFSNTHFFSWFLFLVVTCPRPSVFARPNKYVLQTFGQHRQCLRSVSADSPKSS